MDAFNNTIGLSTTAYDVNLKCAQAEHCTIDSSLALPDLQR